MRLADKTFPSFWFCFESKQKQKKQKQSPPFSFYPSVLFYFVCSLICNYLLVSTVRTSEGIQKTRSSVRQRAGLVTPLLLSSWCDDYNVFLFFNQWTLNYPDSLAFQIIQITCDNEDCTNPTMPFHSSVVPRQSPSLPPSLPLSHTYSLSHTQYLPLFSFSFCEIFSGSNSNQPCLRRASQLQNGKTFLGEDKAAWIWCTA